MSNPTSKTVKKLDLALQGGGSHGAFTWGVLERLLEDERIKIDGICGTSAGAMNGTILAYGLQKGGRYEAIALLEKFWRRVSEYQMLSPLQPSLFDKIFGEGRLDYSPAYYLFEYFTLLFSPYQFNPLNINPLKFVLEEFIDFEELRRCRKVKLFVCATNVRTSHVKVFETKEITAESVMASACLPFLFPAVEIDGEAYWDGGYMGNPPIYPLIDNTDTPDIMIVQINPIRIEHVPKTVDEIRDRVNEISFNSSLIHDIRQINMVRKMLEKGINVDGKFKELYLHRIFPAQTLRNLNVSTKLNAEWNFLQKLRNIGRKMTEEWLAENFDSIGKESTFDLEKTILRKS
jgi:NTE family protein